MSFEKRILYIGRGCVYTDLYHESLKMPGMPIELAFYSHHDREFLREALPRDFPDEECRDRTIQHIRNMIKSQDGPDFVILDQTYTQDLCPEQIVMTGIDRLDQDIYFGIVTPKEAHLAQESAYQAIFRTNAKGKVLNIREGLERLIRR